MNTISELQDICRLISKKCPEDLVWGLGASSWEWDNDNDVALRIFSIDFQDKMLQMLDEVFAKSLDCATAQSAPDELYILIGHFALLREGQNLYTLALSKEILLFAAWWPWESGENISLRIGASASLYYQCTSKDMDSAIQEAFEISFVPKRYRRT